MPETDLDLLLEAAQRAAETATRFVGGPLDVVDKPNGAGPVTAADIAVNDVLETLLRDARPDYGWLSEESVHDPKRAARARTFIIDPIDGTRSFVEGSDTWAHSIAVAEAGQIVAAVVYLPLRGKLYAAALGQGATLNGGAVQVAPFLPLEQAQVLTTRANLDPAHWQGPVPVLKRHHRPSLAYRMALVAEGRFDAMFTFRPSWEWDIAAGALILSEAGATVTDRRGAALRFNNPLPQTDGVIAAGPDLHSDLRARLA